jgi:hypothetical protein
MTFRSTSAFDSSERGKTGPYLWKQMLNHLWPLSMSQSQHLT